MGKASISLEYKKFYLGTQEGICRINPIFLIKFLLVIIQTEYKRERVVVELSKRAAHGFSGSKMKIKEITIFYKKVVKI